MSYSELAQLELMNAAANITTKEDLDAFKLTLSLFFAELAQKAIDKLWDEGKFDQATCFAGGSTKCGRSHSETP